MATIERTVQFKVLLHDYERRMLDQVAETRGITPTDFLREAIRSAFVAKFGEPKADQERRRDVQRARSAKGEE